MVRLTFAILLASFVSASVFADDIRLLGGIVLDAQEQNRPKFAGGRMKYRFEVVNRGMEPVILTAEVRWNRERAFWAYRMSDPSGVFGKSAANKIPLERMPEQYKLRDGDRLYTYNAVASLLHLDRLEYPKRLDATYFLFDVFPQSLGSKCCVPYQPDGRDWSEMVGSNYSVLFPESKITMERIAGNVIRQKRTDVTGSTGIIDFSLNHSGLPISMEWEEPADPSRNSRGRFEWRNFGDTFYLHSSEILRGDFRRRESDATEKFTFQVIDFALSDDPMSMNFNSLKALLPKGVVFVDHIRNRRTALSRDASDGIAGHILEDLADRLKSEGYAKP